MTVKELINKHWSEEFNIDVDVSKNIAISIPPKTYAMLIQMDILNTHSSGIIDWAYKVNVKAIEIHLDFSVRILTLNYEAIKLVQSLQESKIPSSYIQHVDKIIMYILNHFKEFDEPSYQELKNKIFNKEEA